MVLTVLAFGLINLIAGSTFLALAALRAFSLLYGVIPLKAPRERRRELHRGVYDPAARGP